MESELFSLLSRGLEATLRDANPWWRGERLFGLPPVKRWAFDPVLKNLKGGLTPATVIRGPRQIGKTTLLRQIVEELVRDGVQPHRIFHVQFDDLPELRKLSQPILDLTRWFAENVLRKSFNQAAHDGEQAYVFLDEVQNLSDWDVQLKHLVDTHPVKVLVTGSSALRIEAGRDSLAGRITTIEMGPLLVREIGELRGHGQVKAYLPFNGLEPLRRKEFWRGLRDYGDTHREFRHASFSDLSRWGAYPLAHAKADVEWDTVAAALNETVVLRAIQHDLRMGPKGAKRDEVLLREVFRLCCRYIGQAPAQTALLQEVQQGMHANVGWQRIMTYLRFLDGTLLIRLVEPLEIRLKKRRGPPKLCLCDHALRAAWLQERVPLAPADLAQVPHLSDLAGRIAEGLVGYFFRSILNLQVAHFPETGSEPEVDFVLTVGEQRIPIEVKYHRRIEYADTFGLRSFIEKVHYNAPFGLLITLNDDVVVDDPRIVCLSLSSLLMMR